MSQTSISWEPISRALTIEDIAYLESQIASFRNSKTCAEAIVLAVDQDRVKNKDIDRILFYLSENDFNVCLIDGKLYSLLYSLIHQSICGFIMRKLFDFFDNSVEVMPG